MDFNQKPIGIGNLVNLKKRKYEDKAGRAEIQAELDAESDEEVAQLAVDVYENNTHLVIVAPLAGVTPEEVSVEITEDVVVIEGTRVHPLPTTEDREMLVQECYFGTFARSIVLPEAVDSKRAKAEFKKNILIITIPKLDNVRTRVIKIQAN